MASAEDVQRMLGVDPDFVLGLVEEQVAEWRSAYRKRFGNDPSEHEEFTLRFSVAWSLGALATALHRTRQGDGS